MKHFDKFILCSIALSFSASAWAFDTETHALITQQAYSKSVLINAPSGEPNPTIRALGLDRLNIAARFDYYWEPLDDLDRYTRNPIYYTDGNGLSLTGSQNPEPFERCQMQEFLGTQVPPLFQIFKDTVAPGSPLAYQDDTLLPVQNWLVRGAIREDDLGASEVFYLFSSGINCIGYLISSPGEGVAIRSLSHFYDPYLDLPLPLKTIHGVTFQGLKAINWALGYTDPYTGGAADPSLANHFTYADARNMYWWALARQRSKGAPYTSLEREQDAEDRLSLWATTFRSLGDVVHLLEDGAQPQHTRNDPHSKFNTPEQKAFEDYTNDRVLGTNTGTNSYLRAFFDTFPPSFTPPPLGDYSPVNFSTPVRFFTTRSADGSVDQQLRTGLEDYSNRGFFTGGTHPTNGTMAEPNPPAPLDSYGNLTEGYHVESVPCQGLRNSDPRLLQSVACDHFTRDVPDLIFSEFPNELCNAQNPPQCFEHPPLLSDSVLHQFVVEAQSELQGSITEFYQYQFALGISEMDVIGNMAIPRAVAYAAGMLNFFFRGSLQVTAPDDGIYALVDHGTPHTVLPGGVPVKSDGVTTFGFEQVRLKVKNITMADAQGNGHMLIESGTGKPVDQTLSATEAGDIKPDVRGPYLVAIARYHRNPCYQTDLSGEFSVDSAGTYHNPAGCTVATARSAWPEISVSQSVAVAKGALDGPDAQLLTFDFSHDPIPINATDLFFQVAYRGQLGAEQDGIAVGMVDVSEPIYYALFNGTDYVLDTDANRWRPATTNEPQPRTMLSIEICSAPGGGDPWYKTTGANRQIYLASQPLAAGHVVRLAVLKSVAPILLTKKSVDQNGYDWSWASITQIIGTVDDRQAPYEDGTGFNPLPFTYGRGNVVGDNITTLLNSPLGSNASSPYLADWDLGYYGNTPSIASLNSEAIGTVTDPGTTLCSFNGFPPN